MTDHCPELSKLGILTRLLAESLNKCSVSLNKCIYRSAGKPPKFILLKNCTICIIPIRFKSLPGFARCSQKDTIIFFVCVILIKGYYHFLNVCTMFTKGYYNNFTVIIHIYLCTEYMCIRVYKPMHGSTQTNASN